jgi:hypothetical protein
MVYSSYYGSELGFQPTSLPSFLQIFLVVHGCPVVTPSPSHDFYDFCTWL